MKKLTRQSIPVLVELGNSSKDQLKKEAAQWVAQAKKDSKNWNKAFYRYSAK